MGLDDVTGSLIPGKSADFIILSDNPYDIDIDLIPSITTRQTWFAGNKVYEADATAAAQPPTRFRAQSPA